MNYSPVKKIRFSYQPVIIAVGLSYFLCRSLQLCWENEHQSSERLSVICRFDDVDTLLHNLPSAIGWVEI